MGVGSFHITDSIFLFGFIGGVFEKNRHIVSMFIKNSGYKYFFFVYTVKNQVVLTWNEVIRCFKRKAMME